MGTRPLGTLCGGALGTWIGWRPTLMVGGVGILLAAAWVVCSDIRALRAPPDMQEDSTSAGTNMVVPMSVFESNAPRTGD